MPSNRLYYHLKPYLPWGLRMAMRRMMAQRRREVFKDVWPINQAAAQPPEGWPGWPGGKKFALVLTHDVESLIGLAKCHRLMELEMEFGFRSSFNFIPEGEYAVSRELRDGLAGNGFEIGVHDLHHDGRLFWTRSDFSSNARWINHYLKEWNATGFRSGFMLRNLDWLHELNIQYDTSTFDTDPFEPQPDGVGTIFPFWVAKERQQDNRTAGPQDRSQWSVVSSPSGNGPSSVVRRHSASGQSSVVGGHAGSNPSSVVSSHLRSGYVELPYTLPQDSTLFLVLRERFPEIWFRKVDWIAARGGMALVNTHPDYMNFGGVARNESEYPCGFYEQFLDYVATKFRGMYWHALPREMADYFRVVKFPNELHLV